jgi:hypothetical protein
MKPRTARVVSFRRLTKGELRVGLFLYPERVVDRPRTRADCEGGPRPCPYAGCRHHLGFEVRPGSGSLIEVFAGVEVWDMPNTCALDLADAGTHTLEEVGAIFGLTRERIRQIEEQALAKLHAVVDADLDMEELLPDGMEGLTFPAAAE